MLLHVLLGAPLWVWPLLAGLVWYGLRASKARKTSAIAVYLLPLLGAISINTVLEMPNQQLVWIAYAVAYAAGAVMGFVLQRRWLIEKSGMQVELAGEWFTLVVLMVIFWMNFANGTFSVIAPNLYANRVFLGVFALIVGAASGTFGGRAIKVYVS